MCLAALQNHLGMYEEAEVLLRRALAGREKALGPNHQARLWAANHWLGPGFIWHFMEAFFVVFIRGYLG